jgi:hypothetical protein
MKFREDQEYTANYIGPKLGKEQGTFVNLVEN